MCVLKSPSIYLFIEMTLKTHKMNEIQPFIINILLMAFLQVWQALLQNGEGQKWPMGRSLPSPALE